MLGWKTLVANWICLLACASTPQREPKQESRDARGVSKCCRQAREPFKHKTSKTYPRWRGGVLRGELKRDCEHALAVTADTYTHTMHTLSRGQTRASNMPKKQTNHPQHVRAWSWLARLGLLSCGIVRVVLLQCGWCVYGAGKAGWSAKTNGGGWDVRVCTRHVTYWPLEVQCPLGNVLLARTVACNSVGKVVLLQGSLLALLELLHASCQQQAVTANSISIALHLCKPSLDTYPLQALHL